MLDENEEFLAAARQKILTDELLKLPTRLELFTTQTNDSLENVKNDLRSVKNDLSILKGYGQQANLQTEMPARLANILSLRTTRILRVTDDSRGSEDFTDALWNALKEGAISQREYSRVLSSTLYIQAA